MNAPQSHFCDPNNSIVVKAKGLVFGALIFLFASLACQVEGASTGKSQDADLMARSRQIDAFISERLNHDQVQPLPAAEDSVLLRRLYLDLIGRIPTTDEANRYLNADHPEKLNGLIGELLASEGHVSHEFNHWADLLRVQSRMRNLPGHPYVEWIQESFRKNMPYDEFVSNLITAEQKLRVREVFDPAYDRRT